MLKEKLVVSSSPHIFSNNSVTKIMGDVIFALMPATIYGVYIFGMRAAMLVAVSVLSSVLFEYLWCRLTKKQNTVADLSAVLTGLLVALNIPASSPWWMPVIGCGFAIIIVKQFFGGLGQNFINPALAGRAFMLASWPVLMTRWTEPFIRLPLFKEVDFVTSATPLAIVKSGEELTYSYADLFFGRTAGCIGETSAVFLLIGGIYLIVNNVISAKIPVTYIATVAVLTYVFGGKTLFTGDALAGILSGGLFLGAFFMATDYVTSPVTPAGKYIMGIGCGIITFVIRKWGGYPEGVSYSILLMNALTPLIDKYTVPRRYGI